MADFEIQFQERKNEIEQMLKFIKEIEAYSNVDDFISNNLYIAATNNTNAFKSSILLMLYNLVEANTTSVLTYIHKIILDEKSPNHRLIPEINKMLAFYWFSRFDKESSDLKKISGHISDLFQDLFSGKSVFFQFNEFRKNKVQLYSGNLENKKMEALFLNYNVKVNLKGNLKIVMDERNHLAHGSKSFSTCGQDYSVQYLEKLAEGIFNDLTHIHNVVIDFVNEKKYLIQS